MTSVVKVQYRCLVVEIPAVYTHRCLTSLRYLQSQDEIYIEGGGVVLSLLALYRPVRKCRVRLDIHPNARNTSCNISENQMALKKTSGVIPVVRG